MDEIAIKRSVYDPWHVQIDQAEQDLLNEETDFSRVAPNTRAIDDYDVFQGETTVTNFVSESAIVDECDENVPFFC